MEKNIKEAISIIEDVRKSMPECANKAFLKGALNQLNEALSISKSRESLLVPIVGQTYFYFDDGKIRESRRGEVVITDVIPFEKIDEVTLENWKIEVEKCRSWKLYDETTDYFVKAVTKENKDELIFVRSKGGWFSFDNFMCDGRLDFDGSLNASLVNQ